MDKATKEPIALALGSMHAAKSALVSMPRPSSNSVQRVRKALSMAVYMDGGPSLMYAADALELAVGRRAL